MAERKKSYRVLARHGCGGGPANDPSRCWWGDYNEIVKLTKKQADPFLKQGLLIESN